MIPASTVLDGLLLLWRTTPRLPIPGRQTLGILRPGRMGPGLAMPGEMEPELPMPGEKGPGLPGNFRILETASFPMDEINDADSDGV